MQGIKLNNDVTHYVFIVINPLSVCVELKLMYTGEGFNSSISLARLNAVYQNF